MGWIIASDLGRSGISAGQIKDYLEVTGRTLTPFEAGAVLSASRAFCAEIDRSLSKSTDAPWNWPKSARDLEIFAEQEEKLISRLMGD